MKKIVLCLAAIVLAALDASACDRRPVRTFIANHRPGILIPKAAPVYAPVQIAQPSYPTGGVIVQAGCTTGNCPIR